MNCPNPRCYFNHQDNIRACDTCSTIIEKCSIEFSKNLGAPEILGCSECGNWFKLKDYPKHLPCWDDDVNTKNP